MKKILGGRLATLALVLGHLLNSACSDDAASPAADAASGAGGMDMPSTGGRGGSGGGGGAGGSDAAVPQGGDGSIPPNDAAQDDARATDDAGSDAGGGDFDPHPELEDLPEGSARDLGAFECTTPDGENEGQCRAVTDYSGLVYDSNNHQLLMFGGGHSTTMTDTIFAFDLEGSLRWSELYLPTPCDLMVASNLDAALGAWLDGPSGPYPRPLSVHTYDLNAFSPAENDFILVGRSFTGGYCNTVGNDVSGPIAHFALEGGSWSFGEADPSPSIAAAELDPMTGLIIVLGNDGLKLYDPTARSYTDEIDALQDAQGGSYDVTSLGYANHLVYFPPSDTFYYFMRGQPVEVVALKLDRAQPQNSTLELLATDGPSSPHDEPGYDYDAVSATIGGGVHGSTFYAFDPVEGQWSMHTMEGAPGTMAFHALAYDQVSNVFVFVTDPGSGQRTWAYRFRAAP